MQPGANIAAVKGEVQALLRRYGALAPYPRREQLSHSILLGELSQLANMAGFMPIVFLGVAAFLISMVLGRIVQLQRPQIAALKAVGYSNWAVGGHFLKMVSLIILLGMILGAVAGQYLGESMVDLYRKYFHFPDLRFVMSVDLMMSAVGVSCVAAVVGALSSVRSVVALPPAEAMRPEPPAVYRATLADRLQLARFLGQSSRMILREIERNPLRTLLSTAGVSFAVALLVVGRFSFDAVERYMQLTFAQAQRQDMTVTFFRPVPLKALHELRRLPGVVRVEGERQLPVAVSAAGRARELTLRAPAAEARLTQIVDSDGGLHKAPLEGLLVSEVLLDVFDTRVGERLRVRVREGERPELELPIVGSLQDMLGLNVYMDSAALHRVLGEAESVGVAYLQVDPRQRAEVLQALRDRPEIAGVTEQERVLSRFQAQTADQMNSTTWIMTLFAVVIAAGVVYNNARLSLSIRGRDLASLRVLGFYRGEIATLLLGELALQVFLALPLGMWLGTVLAQAMMATADPEQYRFPVIISLKTYVFAGGVTLAAAVVSALLVRRKLDHLDLTAVLKTRG